ncbi:RNA polymerase sigma factor [Streptomyces tubercidicus]
MPDSELSAVEALASNDTTEHRQVPTSRRMADEQLVRLLSEDGFAGPRYERFEEELARYGISVMRGWMHSGFVFKLVASRGFDLKPHDQELERLACDGDLREELAMMTVARSLSRFRERALIGEGWKAEGGASIATYFMGACVYEFPNEFRRHRKEEERWRRGAEQETTGGPVPSVQSVADEVLGNLCVLEDLRGIDNPRARAVVALTIDGYTQEEIRHMLDVSSVRAVEAVLHRWRSKAKRRGRHE